MKINIEIQYKDINTSKNLIIPDDIDNESLKKVFNKLYEATLQFKK